MKRPFSVPVASPVVTDEHYENIFGSEEERKKKMKEAIVKQKAEKSRAKADKDSEE